MSAVVREYGTFSVRKETGCRSVWQQRLPNGCGRDIHRLFLMDLRGALGKRGVDVSACIPPSVCTLLADFCKISERSFDWSLREMIGSPMCVLSHG